MKPSGAEAERCENRPVRKRSIDERERGKNGAEARIAGTGPLRRIRSGGIQSSEVRGGLMLPVTDEAEVKRSGDETEPRLEEPARIHLCSPLVKKAVCLFVYLCVCLHVV